MEAHEKLHYALLLAGFRARIEKVSVYVVQRGEDYALSVLPARCERPSSLRVEPSGFVFACSGLEPIGSVDDI